MDMPRRVVADSEMDERMFAAHIAMRHPGLKLPGHRYRKRFHSKALELAARNAHLEAHNKHEHAHVHIEADAE